MNEICAPCDEILEKLCLILSTLQEFACQSNYLLFGNQRVLREKNQSEVLAQECTDL